MGTLSDALQKRPMLGWAIASVLLIAAAVLVWFQFGRPSEKSQLTQMVTVRCVETGETWSVLRGVMEKELYMRPMPVDPNEGLINPKTGKKTGFPIDQWKETIERVNAERKEAMTPAQAPPQRPTP